MGTTGLRIGIAGCGRAARVHVGRLAALDGVRVVGCADPDINAARALASSVTTSKSGGTVEAFSDHKELLSRTTPDAVAIFTPHRSHYRPAMDALQAGCHVFVEKPLSTNAQEAVDIVGLARGRGRKVAVGHQYRLCPSLVEAKRRLAAGEVGPLRLVTAVLSQPWLESHTGPEDSWRLDPRISGGGILADAGDHLIDALLWTTGLGAHEAAAFQAKLDTGVDVVTAASVRLADGTPATLAISGVSACSLFEITFYGERGRLRATDRTLSALGPDAVERSISLPEPTESIDGNFVAALLQGTPLCCPAEGVLETVRLLEAVARSAATGQAVRLA
jgi:predicted dehydrogenase